MALLCDPIEVKREVSHPKQGQIRTADDLFCLNHTGLGSSSKIYVHSILDRYIFENPWSSDG